MICGGDLKLIDEYRLRPYVEILKIGAKKSDLSVVIKKEYEAKKPKK